MESGELCRGDTDLASRLYHLESVVNRLDYLNKHVSEHGDVQSAVSMYLVLGGGRAGGRNDKITKN